MVAVLFVSLSKEGRAAIRMLLVSFFKIILSEKLKLRWVKQDEVLTSNLNKIHPGENS